jgi:RNAse (barnase) inhibitor barstar
MDKKYHATLATYFQSKLLYLDGENFKKPNIRKLMEQPWQELEAAKAFEKLFEMNAEIKEEREKLWDNVTNTLCNLEFIQAKAAAKMTYELVEDFNQVIQVIPENAKKICQEELRKARMEKYVRDLVLLANGEYRIEELEIPRSITPWNEERFNSEIKLFERVKSSLNLLYTFNSFLNSTMIHLQNYAVENIYFTLQQAVNFSIDGPINESVLKTNNLDLST